MDALLSWVSSGTPVLPHPWVAQMGMAAMWAVVLAWLTMALLVRWKPTLSLRVRCTGLVVVALWTLMPSSLSPAYWLGLAFQSPSLVWALVAGWGVWAQLGTGTASQGGPWAARGAHITVLCALGVLLGWVLMLDTLAMWPRSVYAMGYGGGVVLCAALALLAIAWRWPGTAVRALCAVLLVYVLTRLPTGNVWDALSDPLLWAALHVKLVRDALVKT